MPKQALNRWMPSNVAELRDALAEILTDIACEGADPDTVYVDVRDIALVRETLTDGSAVFNIVMRESLPARDAHVSTSKAAAFVSQVAAHRPGYDTYVDDFDYITELGTIIEQARRLISSPLSPASAFLPERENALAEHPADSRDRRGAGEGASELAERNGHARNPTQSDRDNRPPE